MHALLYAVPVHNLSFFSQSSVKKIGKLDHPFSIEQLPPSIYWRT